MCRHNLLRGASAGALTLVLASLANAQQSLPTIDIGARRSGTPSTTSTGTDTTPGLATRSETSRSTQPKTPAEGYVVSNATTATKTDVPIREVPASVAVVPRQVMVDQNDVRLQDALENVSGVHSNNNDAASYVFKLRGFSSFDLYRNGLLIPSAVPTFTDTANLERIEVLKGPASILFGRAEPGGVINLITKQPLDQPRYVAQQEFGSYDYYRTQWDLTAPVTEIPGLSYRFSGAYQNAGSFREFQGGSRVIIAPVITYRPSTWTEFTVDSQYLGFQTQGDVGLPIIGSQPASIPTSRSFQEPNDPRDRNESFMVSYNFRQNLTEDWKITNRFLYSDSWLADLNVQPISLRTDLVTLNRRARFQDLKGNAFSTNIDMEGKFLALGGKHDFLMGLDYFNSYFDYVRSQGTTIYPINLYFPIYGMVPSIAYQDAVIGSFSKSHQSVLSRQKGLYIQDHISWFDRLHLLIGARYDVADAVNGIVRGQNATKELAIINRLGARLRTDTGWSPRVGAVFDILPVLSAYANYSQSFGANNGISTSGQTFAPERGKQWEFGFKLEAFKGLSATLAFFQITKSGVLT